MERKGGKPSEEGEIKRGNVKETTSREEHSPGNDQSPRDWWNSLNEAWKKVFRGAINITEEPSDADLESMFALETLSIYTDYEMTGSIVNLDPLRKLHHLKYLYSSSIKVKSLHAIAHLTELLSLEFSQ